MSSIPEITTQDFEAEVLHSDIPVLVDLYAPWCGPCRMMVPVLEQVASQLGPRAKVVKINTDEEIRLAEAFGVQGVPTLALVHQGRVVDVRVGFTPAKELVQMVEALTPTCAG